jgi:two-component system sensor histidine kinase YesM
MMDNLFKRLKHFANRSIGNRISIFFIPFTVILITTVCMVSFVKYYATLKDQIIRDTMKIIEQVGNNVDFFFTDIKTPMAMIARNTNVVQALKDYEEMTPQERLFIERDIGAFTYNINSFKSYIGDLIIVGNNGFKLNLRTSSRILYNYDFLNADWLKELVAKSEKGIQYISTHECDYYPKTELPYDKIVSAVLPVYDNTQNIGYIICDINLRKLNRIFDSLNLSHDGVIFMVDQQGKIIFHPNEENLEKQIPREIADHILTESKGTLENKHGSKTDLIIFSKSEVTNWVLVAQIPYKEIYSAIHEMEFILFLIIGISIVCIIVFSLIIAGQIRKPLNLLIKNIERVEQHNFESCQNDYGYGEIAVIGKKFDNMVDTINKLINEVYLSKVRQRETEFEVLRSQINPHFLYNALQLVKAEAVFCGNNEISQLVTSLGYLLRYAMNNKKDMVMITEEMDYIHYYLDIYKRRFENKFDYSINISKEAEQGIMPKLILQPIVENSLLHGLHNKFSDGLIRINVSLQNQFVHFEVFDNGEGIPEESLILLRKEIAAGREKSIGLYNIHSRLILNYGEESGIKIESRVGEYTRVCFKIPFHTREAC